VRHPVIEDERTLTKPVQGQRDHQHRGDPFLHIGIASGSAGWPRQHVFDRYRLGKVKLGLAVRTGDACEYWRHAVEGEWLPARFLFQPPDDVRISGYQVGGDPQRGGGDRG
jgi:hypothetical protein